MSDNVDNQSLFNKTITLKNLSNEKSNGKFNLCNLTYKGKLTEIIDEFNKKSNSISHNTEIINSSFTEDGKRSPLQISAFLNFPNIFLFLLTYDADHLYCDEYNQSTWHIIGYRGHSRLLSLLLNHIRYKMKLKSINNVDNIKKKFGFSKLDIVKGKLSRAVHQNEINKNNFKRLQKALKDEATRLINEFIEELYKGLKEKDKPDKQTPLHLSAISKFPLSYKVIYQILEFNFFTMNESWDDYLQIYQDLQALEIKKERVSDDPRRCMRLERELMTLLGDHFIKKELEPLFNKKLKEKMKEIINTGDTNENTVLHISAFNGDFRIVKKLLFYGGDKFKKNSNNQLPVDLSKDNFVRKVLTNLNTAAKNGESENIKELVDFGEDINEKRSIFSQAPIHKIIENDDKEGNKYQVLKELLDMGADPNIKDSNGWSALHYACDLGDLQSVKILVETKAIIDTYSNNQRIPLHLASYNNYPNIVKYLLENKSNPNYKDELGCTPMHLAAKQGNTECIKFLLDYDGDLYSVDFRGWNILHYAAFHGNKETVYFLCMYDADYDKLRNTRNSQNKLPIEIVRDPSVKPYFMTIFQAAKEGNLDVTKNLINKDDRNLNKQTTFIRNTPLHLAVLNDHYLEVKLLISKGCNISLVNKDNIEAYEFSALMNDAIKKIYEDFDDKERGTIDLRNVVREVIKKKEEVLDATICESNRKIRIWTVQDFIGKIYKLLEEKRSGNEPNDIEEESKKNENVEEPIKEVSKKEDSEVDKYDGEF